MQTINISYLHFWLHSINHKLKSKQQTSFSNRHRFRFAVVSPYFKVLCRRLKSFPLRIVLMFHSRDVTVRLPSFTDRLVYIGLSYVDLYSQEYQWTVTRKKLCRRDEVPFSWMAVSEYSSTPGCCYHLCHPCYPSHSQVTYAAFLRSEWRRHNSIVWEFFLPEPWTWPMWGHAWNEGGR